MPHHHPVLSRAGGLLLVLLLAGPAWAQTRLTDYLCREARDAIRSSGHPTAVNVALVRLGGTTGIQRDLLKRLLASPKAAPYLPEALPRLADLANVRGINELVDRFSSNGMGGAYELAVAHAHRQQLRSVSGFAAGHQLDGELISGTIIEAKSAEPKRPEHLLEQLRRRGADGRRVVLAVGYRPSAEELERLRGVRDELGGRLEVQLIPLSGRGYEILIPGRNVEDPTGRAPAVLAMPVRPAAPAMAPTSLRSRLATMGRGSWSSGREVLRSLLRPVRFHRSGQRSAPLLGR